MNNIDFKKLGDYVKIKTGKLDANASSEDGEYPFFTCSIEPLKISSYSYDCECCLVAGNGDLNVKYYNGKFDAYQRTYIIESLDKEKLDVMYLYFFLSSYIEVLRKQSIGGVIKYIKLGNLTDALIPIPELSKQKEICQNLIKAKKILSSNENLLSKYDTLIKSRFIEMFGDNQTLEFQTLENICSIITDGTHQPPKFTTTGIPFLFVSNIAGNKITYETEKFISERTYEELYKRTPIEIGDVLLSTVGSYGHPAIVENDNKFLFQRHIAYLKPKKDFINSIYFHGTLLSPDAQKQIEERVKGIAQKTLNLSEIRKIKIPVPPLSLQNDFATFVQQIDKSKFEIWRYLKFSDIINKIGFRFYD